MKRLLPIYKISLKASLMHVPVAVEPIYGFLDIYELMLQCSPLFFFFFGGYVII
jgi:hypothetical protein